MEIYKRKQNELQNSQENSNKIIEEQMAAFEEENRKIFKAIKILNNY